MPPGTPRNPLLYGSLVLLSEILLAGCAANPARPGDLAMTCEQITAEIAKQDDTVQVSERRASELRPGYYAFQAAEMIPLIGMGFGIADQIGDASHGRELDHLNEDARDARHREEYLRKMQASRCPNPVAA